MISKAKTVLLILLLSFPLKVFSLDLVTFNYPPFLQSDEKGFVDKFLIDFKNSTNFKFESHKYPIKRALNSYTSGKYFLHLGATDNFSKEVLSNSYIAPIFDLNIYLLFSKSNKEDLQKDLSSLKNIRIGVLRGSIQEEEFAKRHNFSITRFTDSENAFNLLKKGRVDFITFSPLFNTHEDVTGNNNIEDFIYHKDLCYKAKAAFFINKDNKDSESIFLELKSSLKKFLFSSKYKELLDATFGKNIPKGVLKYTKENEES